jgi:hypothetical protein
MFPPRVTAAILFFSIALAAAFFTPALAAEAPRRAAFAPFSSLTEEAKPVAPLLARLLAVRVASLSGADTTVLPPDVSDPAAAAKEGGFPFLVTGTVARVGKGYSLDVSAVDPATGAKAGSFFAEAATEDGLIPALSPLAAQISEKLFGVKAAVPAAPAASTAAPPSPAPAAPAAAPFVAPAVPAAAPSATAPADRAATSFTSLERVARSEAVTDELVSLAAGDDRGADGAELVAMGERTVYLFRARGGEVTLLSKFSREPGYLLLDVASADLDGDGRREFLVSAVRGDALASFVLGRDGDALAVKAEKIPWFLSVLPGLVPPPSVAGQGKFQDGPLEGKVVSLRFTGAAFEEGETLPISFSKGALSAGSLPGLSSVPLATAAPLLLYYDAGERLRVTDADGKSRYRSPGRFTARSTSFDVGPYLPMEGRRASFDLRRSPKGLPSGGDRFLLAAAEPPKGGWFTRITGTGSGDGARLAIYEWTGDDFREAAATARGGKEFSGVDFLAAPPFGRGGKVAAATIEKRGSGLTKPESRIVVYEAR